MASAVRCRAARARACWNISCTSVPRWPLVSAWRFSIMSSAVALSPRLSRRSIWSVTCDAVGVRRVSTPGWTALSTLARPSQPPSGDGIQGGAAGVGIGGAAAGHGLGERGTGRSAGQARAIRATQKRGLIVTWASVKVANPPRARGRAAAILVGRHFSPGTDSCRKTGRIWRTAPGDDPPGDLEHRPGQEPAACGARFSSVSVPYGDAAPERKTSRPSRKPTRTQ